MAEKAKRHDPAYYCINRVYLGCFSEHQMGHIITKVCVDNPPPPTPPTHQPNPNKASTYKHPIDAAAAADATRNYSISSAKSAGRASYDIKYHSREQSPAC